MIISILLFFFEIPTSKNISTRTEELLTLQDKGTATDKVSDADNMEVGVLNRKGRH